jgi:hypothetical protein
MLHPKSVTHGLKILCERDRQFHEPNVAHLLKIETLRRSFRHGDKNLASVISVAPLIHVGH